MSKELLSLVARLRATLGKMEVALGSISDAIVWTGENGKVQWCNTAFDRLVNLPHIQVLGFPLEQVLPLTLNGQAVAAPDYPSMVVMNHQLTESEYQFQTDCGVASLEISGNCVEFKYQERVAVLVIRDVTEAKHLASQSQKAEIALRQSEARYLAFITASAQSVWLTNERGEVVEDIPLWCALTGQSEAEAKGWGWLDTIHPDDRQSTSQTWLEALRTGSLYQVEQRVRVASGEYRLFAVRGVPIFDEQGQIKEWVGTQTDITERKQAAVALERSQIRFRSLFESTSLAILLQEDDGIPIDCNHAAEELFCYSRAELLGKHPSEFSPPFQANGENSLELARQHLAIAYELGKHHFEWVHRRADGSDFSADVWLSVFEVDGHKLIQTVVQDITERKQAEAAIRLQEQNFKTLVENAPDVIIRFDQQSRYLYINSRVQREMGISPSSFIGKTPLEMGFPPKIAYYWQEILAQVFATSQELELEFELPLSGRATYQSFRLVPELNHHGQVESVLAICRDLTDRKQSEDALRRRAAHDSLISSISRQLIDRDLDSAIEFVLRQLAQFLDAERCQVLRYSHSQQQSQIAHEYCCDDIQALVGTDSFSFDRTSWLYHQVLDLAQPLAVSNLDELPAAAAVDASVLSSMGVQSIAIVPMLHSSEVVGFIWLDRVTSPKVWKSEELNLLRLVGELIAMSQLRHEVEAQLRVAKEEAEAANRAKSAFLANMSHELRTPLNSILGFAQLMERDNGISDQQRNFLSTMSRSGEHLLMLINDVLEMSKIEAGRVTLMPTPCDLHQLLRGVEEMFQTRAVAKQLSLLLELGANLPQYLLLDEGKLRQVLINLLGNAIKFTDTGSIFWRVIYLDNTLKFEIQDTGRGIAPEELEHLFQPFVQTASSAQTKEGTGLGLTISRQFVQLMGGDIHVDSAIAIGSTFSFSIKTVLTQPLEMTSLTPNRQVLGLASNQPTYRLLVVDDRPENCELLVHLFSGVGFEVRAAIDGQEAIDLWQSWQPHLIWMDMRMPVMDGYEATQRIRQMESIPDSTKIIALTASAFEEQQERILASGCNDFVSKPFREQILFDKLAEHLGIVYIYADEPVLTTVQTNAIADSLQSTALEVMPVDWITKLDRAAIECDADAIRQLISQIPATEGTLAIALSNLVDRFYFDEILELTQIKAILLREDSSKE